MRILKSEKLDNPLVQSFKCFVSNVPNDTAVIIRNKTSVLMQVTRREMASYCSHDKLKYRLVNLSYPKMRRRQHKILLQRCRKGRQSKKWQVSLFKTYPQKGKTCILLKNKNSKNKNGPKNKNREFKVTMFVKWEKSPRFAEYMSDPNRNLFHQVIRWLAKVRRLT